MSGPHQALANFAEGPPALVSLKRDLGHIYYSATSFPRQSLSALLDQIFDAVGVNRPIRVRSEDRQLLGDVEARTASDSGGKLLYIANFNDHSIVGRVEVNGRPARELFELRGQVKLDDPRVSVPAGETLIFRMASRAESEPMTSTASR